MGMSNWRILVHLNDFRYNNNIPHTIHVQYYTQGRKEDVWTRTACVIYTCISYHHGGYTFSGRLVLTRFVLFFVCVCVDNSQWQEWSQVSTGHTILDGP